jgi:hypothetical protein
MINDQGLLTIDQGRTNESTCIHQEALRELQDHSPTRESTRDLLDQETQAAAGVRVSSF